MDKLKAELVRLDDEMVDIDGKKLKPSQCYHFDTDPVHILFNTNCPQNLREKVTAIVTKYIPSYESGGKK